MNRASKVDSRDVKANERIWSNHQGTSWPNMSSILLAHRHVASHDWRLTDDLDQKQFTF